MIICTRFGYAEVDLNQFGPFNPDQYQKLEDLSDNEMIEEKLRLLTDRFEDK